MNRIYLKPLLILLPIVSILFLVFHYYNSSKEQTKTTSIVESPKVLDQSILSFTKMDGGSVTVKETSAVVIVHFWASWCGPCVEEFPQLIEVANQNEGKVVVLAVSGDSDKSEIDAFLKSFPEAKKSEHFHLIWDDKKDWVKKWAVQKLPESYIYNSERKLVKRVSGAVDWLTEEAKLYMKSLIERPEIKKQ